MTGGLISAVVAVFLALRFRSRLRRRATGQPTQHVGLDSVTSDVGLVALREVKERFRGRIFRVGTLLILAVVAAAIVIPTLDRGKAEPLRVGLVGSLSAPARAAVVAGASRSLTPSASGGTPRTDAFALRSRSPRAWRRSPKQPAARCGVRSVGHVVSSDTSRERPFQPRPPRATTASS